MCRVLYCSQDGAKAGKSLYVAFEGNSFERSEVLLKEILAILWSKTALQQLGLLKGNHGLRG